MNSPPSARTKQLVITALVNYAQEIEDARAAGFTPSMSKTNLLFEIAEAMEWVRSQRTQEQEQEEGFTV